jgi:transposase-like protein
MPPLNIYLDILWVMTAAWSDSRTPALAIVARGDQIEAKSTNEYHVRSQSHPELKYVVTVSRNRWSCSCTFTMEGDGQSCIHILAVKFRMGLQEKAPIESGPECGTCHSSDVILYGHRLNKSGSVRRYECKTCGATFSGKEGFHRRRSDPDIIAKALDLYFRGSSLRQVAEHFAQAYNLPVSDTTVYRWVTHYSALAAEWMNKQGAKVGEKWHVDERVVNVDGENHYLWNVMDSETRFLLASTISKGRGIPEARAAFRRAKKATDVRPKELLSDGYPGYPCAIHREFGRPRLPTDPPRDWKDPQKRDWTPHRRVPSIRAPDSNNILERLNGTSKDRTKTMRAYDNDTGAEALSQGWQVHYNLVRRHLALGKTPGEAAGIPELGGFKWRTILDLATASRNEVAPESES